MRFLLKVIIMVVIVLVVAGLVGGYFARHYAEQQLAKRIEQSVPGSKAKVHISSFPFLGRLAFQGRVARLTAEVTGVVAGTVHFSRIDLDVDDINVNRSDLVHHHQVVIESISKGVASAFVSQQEIDRLTKLPVKLSAGRVEVTVAGVDIGVKASLDAGTLHFMAGVGPSISIPVPTLPVLPCATSVAVLPGQLEIRCVTDTVPAALVQAVSHG
jgi:hypothetical protein